MLEWNPMILMAKQMTEQTGWSRRGGMKRKIAQQKSALLHLHPWGRKYLVCLAVTSPTQGTVTHRSRRESTFPPECPAPWLIPCWPGALAALLGPGLQHDSTDCSTFLAILVFSGVAAWADFPGLPTLGWPGRDLLESGTARNDRSVQQGSPGPAWLLTLEMWRMWPTKWIFIFIYLFFWLYRAAYGILVPRPGIKPVPPLQWKRRVLTAGPPGKSLNFNFYFIFQLS